MVNNIDVSDVVIETKRVILRAFKMSDLNDFYQYSKVVGVGEAAGWLHHKNIEESEIILRTFLERKNEFALVLKENNKVIGSIGIKENSIPIKESLQGKNVVEIGYVLSKDYWGKGLMPECVKEVINYHFKNCEIDVITVGHYDFNIQSKRVIEKCGFKYIGENQVYVTLLGEQRTCINYLLQKR